MPWISFYHLYLFFGNPIHALPENQLGQNGNAGNNDSLSNNNDMYEEEEEESIETILDNNAINLIRNDMISLPQGCKQNKYKLETKMFTSILFMNSRFCYYLVRNEFTLPCEKTLKLLFKPQLQTIKNSLFDVNNIDNLLEIMGIKFENPVHLEFILYFFIKLIILEQLRHAWLLFVY
ncbi:hypothetical protein M9Y10_036321 [Tritrichomonas musculus]|uniref:THAP9-like helix-turn-helix domain-containing protein n=1 Tax=Tritrichomonas musculus TaxID=1915356 RepID=A0ABR2GVU5_9EUKA